ncbi:hypothetical protein NP233_g6176 [Leucocoprinus birnbaumii]|uniref:Uncharacterized protein n=1 Tax=Leucocoprinus birnbaumii TaxID=56174 RepID=A0AAD5VRL9_9AGAR|nr:hypothetical protein NP233_g6176 [Leucocoprinus birnbaumii]
MFSPQRLDSPPPPQTFSYSRPRPWSPDLYGPLPTLSSIVNNRTHTDDPYNTSIPLARRRREASEASVEALDLADYARTLRTRPPGDPYPDFPSSSQTQLPRNDFPSYPPVSFVPEARVSRDSLSPPSLVSRGATLSSSGTHSTSRGGRRPFSLPTPNSSNPALHSHRIQPRIVEPQPTYPGIHPPEIDVSQFPAWSRSWYQTTNRADPPSPPPIDEFYTAIPPSHFNPTKQPSKNVFDPDYIHYDQDYYPATDPSSLPDPVFAPPSSMGHDSTRELLPWSHTDNSPSVDPSTKEERMRMLEREFGPNSRKKGKVGADFLDEDGKPIIGTVDQNGYLVTQGPKKRIALRVMQVLFSLGAGLPAIYAAVVGSSNPFNSHLDSYVLMQVIKANPPAPPSGTAPAYALYVISILSFLILTYLFLLRPCCFNPRRKNKSLMDNPLSGGMMVLPVPSGNNKSKGKKPKKGGGGRGGKGGGGDGDVQVNLIVDPHVFSGGRDDEDSDEDEEGSDVMPGGYYGVGGGSTAGSKAKRRRNKRRSVFAGLAMEAEWKRARGWAKKIAFADVAGLIIWGAVFVIVLIGKRCPSGGFNGW